MELMELMVYVFRRPNKFLVEENLYHLMGYGELKNLFTIEGYTTTGNVTWYYPERFLNILEQRALVERAEAAGFANVTIVTDSVYIIQCVNSNNIRIYQDENILEEEKRFKLSNDIIGLPDDSGLNVLGGKIKYNV